MPSRKKAQGKARKAKEAQSNPNSGFSNGCDHLDEWIWSRDDHDAANSLLGEYRDKFNELGRVGRENLINEVYRLAGIYCLANATYDKYYQLSVARKNVFRQMMLATATEYCVDAANEKDLTKEVNINGPAMIYLIMILTVELRDKYNGAYYSNLQQEFLVSLSDLINCPRQTIKFFHRRNSCECLKDLYYKLKEITKKTSYCFYCKKVVEIRQLSRCHYCNLAQYCSYDCALAHWPEHKVECKLSGCYKPTKPTKTFEQCFYCKKVVEIRQLSRCEHCNVVQYCSYDCALAHWPEHKVECEQNGYYKPKKTTKTSDKLEEVD